MSDDGERTAAGIGARGAAMALDSVVWVALTFVAMPTVGVLTGSIETNGTTYADLDGLAALAGIGLWLVLSIGYHTIFEWRFGRTVGKYLVGIRVTSADGSPPTPRASLVRNVLRLVDWLPFCYLVGIALLAFSTPSRRLGDRIAETTVVRS
ncbi:RDD family protein [Natronorubrum sp. DTA7]|uniref:RDD family protein n=1 Tax=Natronorubrum sp. DTA7 TaxID=3447016 RepID=UPI003F83B2C7